MNTFDANFSSSDGSGQLPRETPQKRNLFFTSAEPSTTPAAPPPSTIFGSSNFGTGASRRQPTKSSNFSSSPAGRSLFPPKEKKPYLFQASSNASRHSDRQRYTEHDEDEDESGYDESGFSYSNRDYSAPSLLGLSTNNKRRSLTSSRRFAAQSSRSQLPRRGKDTIIPDLARDLAKRTKPAELLESDSAILGTEQILRQLDEACQSAQNEVEQFIMVSGAAQELISVWRKSAPPSSTSVSQGHIGPLPHETSFQKGRFVATLLLDLYHPTGENVSRSLIMSDQQPTMTDLQSKPMPQVLLEWLNRHHSNFAALLETVMQQAPNPTASEFFWDAVHTFVLRGQFTDLMRLLAEADFNYALTDGPNGFVRANFSGLQLQSIQAAIYQARQVINACPGLQENDWTVDGQEWDIYRKQVEDAIEQLTELADEHSGNTKDSQGLPYSIYQHVLNIYGILLGDTDVIIGLSQDWLEASMLLTIWWNGTGQPAVEQWSFDVSRANEPDALLPARRSYFQRLKDSFLCVTDSTYEGSFRINPMSPVEVGIASILQGDVRATVTVLETLSLCITSAIAEIGTWMGWLTFSTVTEGLDQEDLVVLNYGNGTDTRSKDQILIKYATALFNHDRLQADDGSTIAGWEIAFSVTSRLDEPDLTQQEITGFLAELPVTDPDTAEKLITVCTELGLAEQGCKVSEAFGDHLVDTTTQYGMALLCYARAHSHEKVRQLTDLLNSYCIVQSKAYPPEQEMDEHLTRLVSDPRNALTNITEIDPVAAEALQFYLVGYACLRKFYNIRDEEAKHSNTKPRALKRTAAKALIAAINSAADSIYGGLYDETRRSAISVDALLPLLGEATALLAGVDGKRALSSDQMFAILAAVEDLQTVNERVFRASEECMEAALRNYHGSQPPSPHTMLKKSVSSGTNSNFSFSMMGSEMLVRSEESLGGKSLDSAVFVDKPGQKDDRGWDWRSQFKDRNTTANDVLTLLRIGIAREMSIASLEQRN